MYWDPVPSTKMALGLQANEYPIQGLKSRTLCPLAYLLIPLWIQIIHLCCGAFLFPVKLQLQRVPKRGNSQPTNEEETNEEHVLLLKTMEPRTHAFTLKRIHAHHKPATPVTPQGSSAHSLCAPESLAQEDTTTFCTPAWIAHVLPIILSF
jgi:hypothetical protein